MYMYIANPGIGGIDDVEWSHVYKVRYSLRILADRGLLSIAFNCRKCNSNARIKGLYGVMRNLIRPFPPTHRAISAVSRMTRNDDFVFFFSFCRSILGVSRV